MAPINLPDGSQVSEIVLPDGSTASVVIAPDGSTVFGNAIPDAVDYHWPQDAGSGTTATAAIGDVDLDIINGGNWTNRSAFSGGTAPLLDGTDDYEISKSAIDINGPQATVAAWAYDLSLSGDDFARLFSSHGDPTTDLDNGWTFFFDQNITSYRGGAYNSGSFNQFFVANGPDPTGTDLFIAASVDNDSGRLRIFDTNKNKLFDQSGSGTRATTSSEPLLVGATDGNYVGGNFDNIFASTDSVLSDTELDQIITATSR